MYPTLADHSDSNQRESDRSLNRNPHSIVIVARTSTTTVPVGGLSISRRHHATATTVEVPCSCRAAPRCTLAVVIGRQLPECRRHQGSVSGEQEADQASSHVPVHLPHCGGPAVVEWGGVRLRQGQWNILTIANGRIRGSPSQKLAARDI